MKFWTNAFIRAAKVTEVNGDQVTVETGETFTIPPEQFGIFVGDYLIQAGPNLDVFAAYPANTFEANFREI